MIDSIAAVDIDESEESPDVDAVLVFLHFRPAMI